MIWEGYEYAMQAWVGYNKVWSQNFPGQTEEMLSITDFQHEIQTQNFLECHYDTATF
jgi:hypothetical protein